MIYIKDKHGQRLHEKKINEYQVNVNEQMTMRHYLMPVRMTYIKKSQKQVFSGMWRKGSPNTWLVKMQTAHLQWKTERSLKILSRSTK